MEKIEASVSLGNIPFTDDGQPVTRAELRQILTEMVAGMTVTVFERDVTAAQQTARDMAAEAEF